MTTISAQTILRSRNAAAPDKVLSTLLLRYPRCIHAEFMTHRMLSRNAASSRAIPVEKLIQDVINDPFVPVYWGQNQKGMQAGEEINEDVAILPNGMGKVDREEAWLAALVDAVGYARSFNEAGYHKQIVNRLIEPFAHITVLASGTEWQNFLALRDHKDAEPHIAILAREVRKCLEDESTIQTLQPGDWHLPFVTADDWGLFNNEYLKNEPQDVLESLKKLAVARCASTSYKTVDGFDMTLEKAIALHDKLVAAAPLHASPAEHVAQADEEGVMGGEVRWMFPEQHGNFIGFRQYRKMLPGEYVTG